MQASKDLSSRPVSAAKYHAFIDLIRPGSSVGRWHTICSNHCNKQDWLPGVAGTQPRLGFWFWGVSSRKRGLAPAPFFISSVVGFFDRRYFPRVSQNFYDRRRVIPWVYFFYLDYPGHRNYSGNVHGKRLDFFVGMDRLA